MSKIRKIIPRDTVDKIMVLCKHKCCWCELQKATDIHHIDEDTSNNDEDNLFPCCSNCHKEIHTKIPFARNITKNELKIRRNDFYVANSNLKVSIIKELNEIKPVLLEIHNKITEKNDRQI